MKKFLLSLGIVAFVVALAAPAFAWHVSEVSASVECEETSQVLTVDVDLSDNGPGFAWIYVDEDEVDFSFFGDVDSFTRTIQPLSYTGTHDVTVYVIWHTQEEDEFVTEASFPTCEIPPTTTTTTEPPATTTTTVVEATTTTVPPATTTSVPTGPTSTVPAPVPAASAPAELPATGIDIVDLLILAGACLTAGVIFVGWKARRGGA